jgi:hypothetical protein
VRRGDQREAVVVVDDREPVCQRVRHALDRGEESEVDSALRHGSHRLVKQGLVLGHYRPKVHLGAVVELDDTRLETGGDHGYKR